MTARICITMVKTDGIDFLEGNKRLVSLLKQKYDWSWGAGRQVPVQLPFTLIEGI